MKIADFYPRFFLIGQADKLLRLKRLFEMHHLVQNVGERDMSNDLGYAWVALH